MQNVIVNLPLRGEWVALKPPGHHLYAIDLMKVGGGKKYFGRNFLNSFLVGIPSENFYSWSEPIFAPFDGTVVRVSDGWPDRKKVSILNTALIWFTATFLFRPNIDGAEVDIRPNAGNYVMIQSVTGPVAFMAHMRSGSVKVTIGQRITSGQLIGKVGNSGNTTAPHLHLNMFDQVTDLLRAKVIPFGFNQYERWSGRSWEVVRNTVPNKLEIIRNT